MGRRVLVTRPEPGASATATRLRAAGFEPLLLPLTEIVPLHAALPEGLFDAVAVSSANAVRHATAAMIERLDGTACFAVGAETAQAARQAGFGSVIVGGGDAAALAKTVIGSAPQRARVLYLAGRVRRPTFEQTVRESGRDVVVVETYDTLAMRGAAARIDTVAGGEPIDAVLLYSALASELLAELVAARPEVAARLEAAFFLGLSARVGTALRQRWRERFCAAGTPDEDALFNLLEMLSRSAP